MRIGVSLPDELIVFADAEAARRGTSRSGLLAELLDEARTRERTRRYIDAHGWDVAENEEASRAHQRTRVAREHGEDAW